MIVHDGSILNSMLMEFMFVVPNMHMHLDIVLDKWKDDICGRDRQSACHRNAFKLHESTHVTTACAIFGKYVSGCGCTQPHQHHICKKDGIMVLLPMNAKKKDI